jgi:tRNA nucleotidyltransferase (CCA-adding enzyme)
MNINLDKNTTFIINELEKHGFTAYSVGGALRNLFLGLEVTDYDITTSALPEETKTVFSGNRIIETGIKHGTVTLILDEIPYEITTFRTESSYSDSRHPDSVSFVTDINADLSRRDFTMNAIAFSPSRGIVDPFNGVEDIKKRVIKTVGTPEKRFSEDALRILRALRFSSVLGFEIDDSTSQAIFTLSDNLKNVSPERIYTELKKLLLGDNAQNVINKYLPIFEKIIPVNGSPEKIECLPKNHVMRLACLCGNMTLNALEILRADNRTRELATLLSDSEPIPKDMISKKLLVSSLGRENAKYLAAYRRALFGEDDDFMIEHIADSSDCLSVSELEINGNDLSKIGLKGKQIGKTLSALLDSVISGETENKKSALLEKAKRIHNL